MTNPIGPEGAALVAEARTLDIQLLSLYGGATMLTFDAEGPRRQKIRAILLEALQAAFEDGQQQSAAEVERLTQAYERLKLERDSARDQFDAHVEWASRATADLEAENARLRAALEEIGDCGGKGFSHYCPNCSRKFNGNVALRHTPAPADERT